jgi:predicted Zn-dependent protease
VEISGGDSKSVVALAHAYAAAGRKAEAEKMLRDLERNLSGTADSSYAIARIYASEGERDKAFEFLDRAYAEKSFEMSASVRSDLVLDSLRSDPRFQSLLRRMGLNV